MLRVHQEGDKARPSAMAAWPKLMAKIQMSHETKNGVPYFPIIRTGCLVTGSFCHGL